VSLDELIESRILEAMEQGAFDRLPGAGRPQRIDGYERHAAGDNWLGYHILSNARVLPPWLDLAREIEQDRRELDRIEACHARAVEEAARRPSRANRETVRAWREAYEAAARALRIKQDRFNIGAPGIRSERPGLWVERALERLEAREAGLARAARSPAP
jgi:hypothetical protein